MQGRREEGREGGREGHVPKVGGGLPQEILGAVARPSVEEEDFRHRVGVGLALLS
jgi:hypothetical protein